MKSFPGCWRGLLYAARAAHQTWKVLAASGGFRMSKRRGAEQIPPPAEAAPVTGNCLDVLAAYAAAVGKLLASKGLAVQ
ncbi:MAG: hypothetical protein ABI995_01585 [Acidobacteriota bacterium]